MISSVGIIGNGFIGGALYHGFSSITDVKIFDINPSRSPHTLTEVIGQDIIFLCIPTPMNNVGECSTKNLEQELKSVLALCDATGQPKSIVIKSTIPPDFFRRLTDSRVVYMPEFLTERTSNLDFIQSTRFIFGVCDRKTLDPQLSNLFRTRFPNTRQVIMSWEEASLVKYATNNFFTVKLSFFNELMKLCNEIPTVSGTEVINEVIEDGRIGRSHFQVPGPDGKAGWGGHCFPKDNRALIFYARSLGIDLKMLETAWTVNIEARGIVELREELKNMEGRAVKWKTSEDTNE